MFKPEKLQQEFKIEIPQKYSYRSILRGIHRVVSVVGLKVLEVPGKNLQ